MKLQVSDKVESRDFKRGDIVILKESRNDEPKYKGRLVIVTEDTKAGDWRLSGFCLVDLKTITTFDVNAFELFASQVTLSN